MGDASTPDEFQARIERITECSGEWIFNGIFVSILYVIHERDFVLDVIFQWIVFRSHSYLNSLILTGIQSNLETFQTRFKLFPS